MKPDFFRHEGLQDLEELHPRIMLFFAGLWCQCDKAGHFRWKPKQIKLDVLPFIEYSPSTYLEVLKDNGYLSQYSVEGEDYGKILNFKKHQLIWGSESQAPVRWPDSEKEVLKYVQSTPEDNGVRRQETGDRRQESLDFFRSKFDEARKNYPGDRNGIKPEWDNFLKKNRPDLAQIIPLLLPAIEAEKQHKAQLLEAGKFCPPWKNFQTWINKSCWTQEPGQLSNQGTQNGKQQSHAHGLGRLKGTVERIVQGATRPALPPVGQAVT